MKVLFTADLHGQFQQYKLLFKKADEFNADVVIIGGDIAPKGPNNPINLQRFFLTEVLLPFIKENQLKHSRKILIMMGNDDFASNMDVLEEYDGKLFDLINMKKIVVEDISFLGYSYVPVTPFALKDWEKWDNDNQPADYIRLDGVKSEGNTFVTFKFDPNNRTDSIHADMNKFSKLCDSKTILVSHAPPFDTKLDLISNKLHVGSRAIREFIEKNQPLLSLHGHIHETVDVSGSFTNMLGDTLCISVGNYHDKAGLAVILIDTDKLNETKREII